MQRDTSPKTRESCTQVISTAVRETYRIISIRPRRKHLIAYICGSGKLDSITRRYALRPTSIPLSNQVQFDSSFMRHWDDSGTPSKVSGNVCEAAWLVCRYDWHAIVGMPSSSKQGDKHDSSGRN